MTTMTKTAMRSDYEASQKKKIDQPKIEEMNK